MIGIIIQTHTGNSKQNFEWQAWVYFNPWYFKHTLYQHINKGNF